MCFIFWLWWVPIYYFLKLVFSLASKQPSKSIASQWGDWWSGIIANKKKNGIKEGRKHFFLPLNHLGDNIYCKAFAPYLISPLHLSCYPDNILFLALMFMAVQTVGWGGWIVCSLNIYCLCFPKSICFNYLYSAFLFYNRNIAPHIFPLFLKQGENGIRFLYFKQQLELDMEQQTGSK